jgi:hypothetical protein
VTTGGSSFCSTAGVGFGSGDSAAFGVGLGVWKKRSIGKNRVASILF